MYLVNIPVYYNPENSEVLEAIHGSITLHQSELKNVFFIKLPNALCADIVDDIEVTRIYYGDNEFISNLKVNEVIYKFQELKI
jgi:hypothetical protein